MSDAHVIRLVEMALAARDAGDAVDLDELCAEHPELRRTVASALSLDTEVRSVVSSDPLLGKRLADRYELRDWLGAGAMGVVYSAHDESLDRRVAVKVLQQGLFASESRRQRFLREARVLASLQHRNIVPIYDHGVTADGLHFIVMRQISGEPLAKILRRHSDSGEVPAFWLAHAVTWCAQITSALACAHGADVLHRDVKPSNILIDDNGEAILVDFGIATQPGEETLTVSGSPLGTPSYMAPEQAADSSSPTERVDIYGLCATLYHLVTFRSPYLGDYNSVLQQLRTKEPSPPAVVAKGLPRDLCAIIERGMHREPDRRYTDMNELDRDLRAFLEHRPVRARPVTPIQRQWRRIRRRPWPFVAALAVIALVPLGFQLARASAAADERGKTERNTEYADLHKRWPPSAAFEGSLESRKALDRTERARYITQARRMLELRPEDGFTRMALVGLLLDQGEHEAATAALRPIRQFEGSPTGSDGFLESFIARHASSDRGTRGAAAVHATDVAAPKSSLEAFIAAFRAARLKDRDTAVALLGESPRGPNAEYLAISVWFDASLHAKNDERIELRRRVIRTCEAIEARLGYATARTLYFRGSALSGLGRPEPAFYALQRAHALSPSFGPTFNLARQCISSNRLDAAEQLAIEARRQRPDNKNADLLLVDVLCRQTRFEEATRIATAIPRDGHLVQSWDHPRMFASIEHHRMIRALGVPDTNAARLAARQCIEHCDTALAALPEDGRQTLRASLTGSRRLAHAVLRRRRSVPSSIAFALRSDPTDDAKLDALSVALTNLTGDDAEQALQLTAHSLKAIAAALRLARNTSRKK